MTAAVCDVTAEPCLPPVQRTGSGGGIVLPLRWRTAEVDACCWMPEMVGGGTDPEPDDAAAWRRTTTIRILLADDHAIVRDSLARLLQMQEGLEVVGRAGDGQQAVDLATELEPDVIVMDVTMPKLNGMQATRRIKSLLPHVRVIALSMHRAADMEDDMKAAGACHYLAKTAAPAELVKLIRSCFPGN